jgi:hypothetical protein
MSGATRSLFRLSPTPRTPSLAGRKLAASFHIAGESGPMTWHAKALQTSYVTAPGGGAPFSLHPEQRFLAEPPPASLTSGVPSPNTAVGLPVDTVPPKEPLSCREAQ